MNVMMKCGHAAQGVDTKTGKPVCVICFGITPELTIAAQTEAEAPNLTGRTARCAYYGGHCHSEEPSSVGLPFFEHHPERPHDSYYCGCYGWD